MIEYLKNLSNTYPIFSIEDPLDEDDWDGWKNLNLEIGKEIQIVGDDLFVTNPERLLKGIEESSANSILIKVNQIDGKENYYINQIIISTLEFSTSK